MGTEDYEGWKSADMIPIIKEKISMWDLLDAMEIDYPRRAHDGVKIAIRDERTESCHVYEDHFYDYGSGKAGDVLDFYMLLNGKTHLAKSCRELLNGDIGSGNVKRTIKEVTDLTDRFMSESDLLEEHHKDVMWFLEHKWAPISYETAALAGVRATKHSIWIPFWKDGNVIGVKVRGWSGVKSSMKGSTFGTSLWSPFSPPRPVRHLVVCEGESDTLALWQHLSPIASNDFVIVGLPSGAGKWNERWLDPWLLPKDGTTVVVMQDNDDSGQKVSDKIKRTHERVKVYQTETDVRSDLADEARSPWIAPLMKRLSGVFG